MIASQRIRRLCGMVWCWLERAYSVLAVILSDSVIYYRLILWEQLTKPQLSVSVVQFRWCWRNLSGLRLYRFSNLRLDLTLRKLYRGLQPTHYRGSPGSSLTLYSHTMSIFMHRIPLLRNPCWNYSPCIRILQHLLSLIQSSSIPCCKISNCLQFLHLARRLLHRTSPSARL